MIKLLLIFFLLCSPAWSATFGTETKQANAISATDWQGTKYTAPVDGTIVSITCYLDEVANDGSGGTVNFGIYNDNGGAVGTFIASGTASDPGNIDDWYTITVSATVIGGNAYWLVMQHENEYNIYYGNGAANQYEYDTAYAPGYDTWGDNPSGGSFSANILSIYATIENPTVLNQVVLDQVIIN